MTLIVIEGPDGAGKTTLAKALGNHIPEAIVLREPGSSPISEYVRNGMKTMDMNVQARQLLMHGCRLDMVANHDFTNPDKLYILDRYVLSTYVYASTDGIEPWRISQIVDAFPVPIPDLQLVLLPSWSTIASRMKTERNLDKLEGDMRRLNEVYWNYGRASTLPEIRPYTYYTTSQGDALLRDALELMRAIPSLTKWTW